MVPIRWVLIRDPEGKFPTQALLCTDLNATPQQILEWFVQRWQLETTFQEVRTHLGVETQRQWNDQAIDRTTPALLALFSLLTLMAHQKIKHLSEPSTIVRTAAWYSKTIPTFSDALATVRNHLWKERFSEERGFWISQKDNDIQKLPDEIVTKVAELLAYAA